MPSQTEIQLTQEQLADFAVYYEGDYKPLVGLLIRWGTSRHEAEDVAQEAMHAALMSWPTVQSPKAFVRTVAHRILHRGWQVAEREACAARRVAQDAMVEAFDANEDRSEYLRMLRALPEASAWSSSCTTTATAMPRSRRSPGSSARRCARTCGMPVGSSFA